MKIQSTTNNTESKTASAPFETYGTSQMYPTLPEYLVSSTNMMPPQQYTPICVMPPYSDVMYPISHMTVPNNDGVANVNHHQQQSTSQQQVIEEEKPYFVHTLNRHTDTLMKLALRYHCTEEDIKMLNSLLCDDLDLYEGVSIFIPKCDPSLIKKNYDLEETKLQTERQRHLMVTTFSRNNNITIDEAKVYLEMNDWNSRKAQEELLQDQSWEKQTTGSVKKPSDFKEPKSKIYTATNHGTISHRSVRNDDKYPQYGYEMMTYER